MTLCRRTALPFFIAAVLVAAALLQRTSGAPERAERHRATVQRVVDGDTIRLAGLGSVRLIGIDTPEVYGRVDCFGPQASAFTKSLLRRGTRVRYLVGAEPRDRYGRLLAYVWLGDGRMVNELLAARGYATTLTIAPNDRFAARFAAAESRARRARAGMWSRPGCAG